MLNFIKWWEGQLFGSWSIIFDQLDHPERVLIPLKMSNTIQVLNAKYRAH